MTNLEARVIAGRSLCATAGQGTARTSVCHVFKGECTSSRQRAPIFRMTQRARASERKRVCVRARVRVYVLCVHFYNCTAL